MTTSDPDLNVWTTTGHHEPGGRHGLSRAANLCALLAGLAALAIALTALFDSLYRTSPAPPELTVMRMEPVEPGDYHVDSRQLNDLLLHERANRTAAERELTDVRGALAIAKRTAEETRQKLLAEQETRKLTEQTLGILREELVAERNAREAAETATKEALNRKPKAWRLKKVESHWW